MFRNSKRQDEIELLEEQDRKKEQEQKDEELKKKILAGLRLEGQGNRYKFYKNQDMVVVRVNSKNEKTTKNNICCVIL